MGRIKEYSCSASFLAPLILPSLTGFPFGFVLVWAAATVVVEVVDGSGGDVGFAFFAALTGNFRDESDHHDAVGLERFKRC